MLACWGQGAQLMHHRCESAHIASWLLFLLQIHPHGAQDGAL